jgi:hypothetical protein
LLSTRMLNILIRLQGEALIPMTINNSRQHCD